MCYGKPAILVPTPSHTEQINNAKQAQDLGAARVLAQSELSREKLLETVRSVLDSGMRKRLAAMQAEVLRHDGLESIAKSVVEMAEK
jgi:UDP-N-acetylglucosamine:LPS N-acetylglucosamine transferase